jgi:hypothetical protein
MERENFETNCENNIEFIRNAKVATCSFSQGKYITKIKKLAEKYPDECEIVAENKDGSIVAHFPVKWIHISNLKREMSEEERKAMGERLRSSLQNA